MRKAQTKDGSNIFRPSSINTKYRSYKYVVPNKSLTVDLQLAVHQILLFVCHIPVALCTHVAVLKAPCHQRKATRGRLQNADRDDMWHVACGMWQYQNPFETTCIYARFWGRLMVGRRNMGRSTGWWGTLLWNYMYVLRGKSVDRLQWSPTVKATARVGVQTQLE